MARKSVHRRNRRGKNYARPTLPDQINVTVTSNGSEFLTFQPISSLDGQNLQTGDLQAVGFTEIEARGAGDITWLSADSLDQLQGGAFTLHFPDLSPFPEFDVRLKAYSEATRFPGGAYLAPFYYGNQQT